MHHAVHKAGAGFLAEEVESLGEALDEEVIASAVEAGEEDVLDVLYL